MESVDVLFRVFGDGDVDPLELRRDVQERAQGSLEYAGGELGQIGQRAAGGGGGDIQVVRAGLRHIVENKLLQDRHVDQDKKEICADGSTIAQSNTLEVL